VETVAMIQIDEFRKHAHDIVDWMADYLEHIQDFPVKSPVKPDDIKKQLPARPPEVSESIPAIMEDFREIILPGMTHWQSPGFFAYFNANSSYPSILAEMLTATMGAQCMIWETSPAATELEETVMNWLKDMLGLPGYFEGVIQDTASSATLCAILSARERASSYQINQKGLHGETYRVYGSTQTHSSIDKAVKIAGLGAGNLVKVPVDAKLAMDPAALEKNIESDLKSGKTPLCVIATLGTTGTTAVDPLSSIAKLCRKHKIWLHVDAAFGGTALVLPEYRWMTEGMELADSFVFNPHKWMFTNFDCSAYFVKDPAQLVRTFEILPEYLKTQTRNQVKDYRDWGIALGRRFRALKLWFVIRNFGVQGIQAKIREHIQFATDFASVIKQRKDFELMTEPLFNVVCFRFVPDRRFADEKLNHMNESLLHGINATGKAYFTHTKINGIYTLRMVLGQTYLKKEHIEQAWELILETAGKMI
jgi:aromatic-L-amino-acid decarboxylase